MEDHCGSFGSELLEWGVREPKVQEPCGTVAPIRRKRATVLQSILSISITSACGSYLMRRDCEYIHDVGVRQDSALVSPCAL